MPALHWVLWNIWFLNKAGKVTAGELTARTSTCFYKEINDVHFNEFMFRQTDEEILS